MKAFFAELKKELMRRKIPLSYQRLKVLEYLTQNQSHPTVDQIFTDLQQEISTLSKTTVYNTLRVLDEAGLVRVINIENHETRYDINVENHGHFKCESCGKIYDFRTPKEALTYDDLKDFVIKERNVYFNGFCPQCRPKNK